MARQPQRAGNNTVSHAAQVMADAEELAVPPAGVILRSEEERTVWDQFVRARAKADWRPMDLILLGKVVRIEVDYRRHLNQLEQEGVVIQNNRGTPVENPLGRVVDTLLRQQLAIIRSMSLTAMPSDSRTVAAQAREENNAREVLRRAGGAAGLLAGATN